MTTADTAGAILTVDLDAVAANWRALKARLAPGAACAANLKADAYGLGAERVAPALHRAGCRAFFVSAFDEGIALRGCLPADAEVHVLAAPIAGNQREFAARELIPVLNGLGDLEAWSPFARSAREAPPCDLHLDTGMRRLGLPPAELARLIAEPARLKGVAFSCLISHLACADEPRHPMNRDQLEKFRAAASRLAPHLGAARLSLANSSGIFLGPEWHFDLVRPGAALFGIAPLPDAPNPMRAAVRLQGKILQIRDVDAPETVGYGATHRVARPGRVATVAVGYADGYPRSLSNAGSCILAGHRVPVVGRVSMDLLTLDVSGVPEAAARPGALVDLIGPELPVDDVGAAAGTIGYEILTRLGRRYHRVYIGGAD